MSGSYGSRSRCGLRRSGIGTFHLVRSRNIRTSCSLSRGISQLGGNIRRRLLNGGSLNGGSLGFRLLILHVSRLRRNRSRLSRCRNRSIRGRKCPHISEGQVILHQIVKVISFKVISGKLIHINRRKLRSNRLTRQTIRRGCRLLQVNTGIRIHAAQLTNHHGTCSRSVTGLQRLRNSATLSTQTLHSATPQRHATDQ